MNGLVHDRPVVNLLFHLRCAERDRSADVHRQLLEMWRWADGKISDCTIAEHHLSGDGFFSTPLDGASMVLAVSDTLKVSLCALLAALYRPLHLAERLTFLDLTSQGRIRAVFGLGYRQVEYSTAGVDWDSRGAVMDRLIEQVLALLEGDTVDLDGVKAELHHLPQSSPQDLVLVGGNSARAARRAARFGLAFWPALEDPQLKESYMNFCSEYGTRARYHPLRFRGFVFLAEDPEAAWSELGSYMLYDAMAYQSIGNSQRRSSMEATASDIAALKEAGTYRILTPEEALADFEIGANLTLNPLVGGLPTEWAWRCLDLYENQVLPHLTLDERPFREIAWE